jgi:phospholipid transport system substrate-binding protein
MIYKFRKHKKRGWLVYDVNILGVSFIQTYRSQFAGVLKTKTMDELIEDLKNPEKS